MKKSLMYYLTGALICSIFIGACTKVEFNNPLETKHKTGSESTSGENQPPTIVLIGPSVDTIDVAAGQTWSDPGVTISDDRDNNLTADVIGSVNDKVNGEYQLTYKATDSGKLSTTKRRMVVVINGEVNDNTPPILSLKGNETVVINQGGAFTDPGYDANDAQDGKLNDRVQVSGTVDVNTPGTYTLIYSVEDAGGLVATKERTIIVEEVAAQDSISPVIELSGSNTIYLTLEQDYVEPGYSASDITADGTTVDLTDAVEIQENYNVDVAGNYSISYTVSDAAGNSAFASRTIVVTDPDNPPVTGADTVAPVITLLGKNPMTMEVGTEFDDPGATAADAHEGDLTDQIEVDLSDLDITTKGSYDVIYTCTDSSGNIGRAVRRVTVVTNTSDTTKPVITVSEDPLVFEIGDEFVYPAATATDEASGDLTESIEVTHNVDMTTAGKYQVTYTVSDKAGNEASVTLEVTVLTEGGTEIIELVYNTEYDVEASGVPMTFSVPTKMGDQHWSPETMTIRISATGGAFNGVVKVGDQTFDLENSYSEAIQVPNEPCTIEVIPDGEMAYSIKYGS